MIDEYTSNFQSVSDASPSFFLKLLENKTHIPLLQSSLAILFSLSRNTKKGCILYKLLGISVVTCLLMEN